jgi:hypothetical protein
MWRTPYLLAADHHLATAALLNVCLRRAGVSDDVLHEARLGALLHELIDLPAVRDALQGLPLATALAQYLKGETADCPDTLRPHQAIIDAIHCGQAPASLEGYTLCLVGLAAQRIKQYVFETPGLPEIRGASLILDAVVHQAAEEVAEAIGRECILQRVASTLIFLAPEPADWEPRLKRRFYEATQVGFCAAAAAEVALQDYLQQYGACMTRLLKALDADRYRAELPTWECPAVRDALHLLPKACSDRVHALARGQPVAHLPRVRRQTRQGRRRRATHGRRATPARCGHRELAGTSHRAQ